MIPVKVCGITSFLDAEKVIDSGASLIGFIFYKKSQRYVNPQDIHSWINRINGSVKKVGVFVNEDANLVSEITKDLKLDFVQLHGQENHDYCAKMIKPVIKALHVGSSVGKLDFDIYKVHSFLLDTFDENNYGGTGKSFNWSLLGKVNFNIPIILSGGLNRFNVLKAIELIKPDAIDLSSGLESSPGKKDYLKIDSFFNTIKNVKYDSNLFKNNNESK